MKEERTISLKGMRFHAYHGVMENEAKIGAEYEVSITLSYDWTRAGETDELCGTLNYAEVWAAVNEQMQIRSQLIEHVCQRIADAILHRFAQITALDVSVSKLNPPMPGETEAAEVRLSQSRQRTE